MKKLFWILFSFCFIFSSQGPNPPGTMADDGAGNFSFANPDNAKTENGVSATGVAPEADIASSGLQATNFGFLIPGGSTINGVVAEWKAARTVALNARNNSQRLMIGGVDQGHAPDAGNIVSNLTSTLTFYLAGGAGDTWGSDLPTVSQVNATGFGFVADFMPLSVTTISVDFMRVTVYYTTAAGLKKRVIGYGGGITKTEDIS